MLVFYFRGHAFVVYLRTIKVHNDSVFKELTVHFLLQKSHLWNPPCLRISKRKYLPMPSEFHNREPPSPSEIQKAVRGIGMDIFWNRPMSLATYNLDKAGVGNILLDRCVQYIYRVYNVKYSAVIVVIIIFLHHHMRESSWSCIDETHSLHGAAKSFHAIAIVELVFILIVNFQHTILS